MKGAVRMARRRTGRLRAVLLGLFALAVLLGFVLASGWVGQKNEAEQAELVRAAVEQALVSCYAAEGRYPQDLAYLEQHYGVWIDHTRYVVAYDAFADNIRPRVRVIQLEG